MAKLTVSVATSATERVDVDAWRITGTDVFAVTRAVRGTGYMVTHVASGLRMPGEAFRTIRQAREAYARMVALMPDADTVADVVLAKTTWTGPAVRRMSAAWRQARGIEPMPALVDILRDALPDGWDGDEDTLTCPHGYTFEHDGRCPSGCVSPLVAAGLV